MACATGSIAAIKPAIQPVASIATILGPKNTVAKSTTGLIAAIGPVAQSIDSYMFFGFGQFSKDEKKRLNFHVQPLGFLDLLGQLLSQTLETKGIFQNSPFCRQFFEPKRHKTTHFDRTHSKQLSTTTLVFSVIEPVNAQKHK